MSGLKKGLRLIIALFFINSLAATQVLGQFGVDKEGLSKRNEPIEITADRMEAFNEKNMVVFSGQAKAVQGDITLHTDRLVIFYKKKGQTKKSDIPQMGESGGLDRIEAQGKVKVQQKQMTATGDEAVYYQDTAQIIMTGNALLQDGKNKVSGCRVVIFIDEGRGKVEACDPEKPTRVRAVIHPQDNTMKTPKTLEKEVK